MVTPHHNDEPVTGRIRKAVDEKVNGLNRRSADRLWALIQPVAIYLICGTIAGALALWIGQTIQGQEIRELNLKITKLEDKADKFGELTQKVGAIEARRDEFNYWRDSTDRRISDLAALLVNEVGRPQQTKPAQR